MKIYISNYRSHWISPYKVLEKVLFWKDWEKIDYDTPWVEKWSDRITPLCKAWQTFLDFIHPKITYVKIDRWDTWSMDHTLAYMILPMLKQLKIDKHGAPFTDDDDVPEELKSISAAPKVEEWDTDEFHFQRWDWIMDEMIWAFEQKVTDDDEHQFFDHSAYDNDGRGTNKWLDDMSKGESKTKVDWEGLKAHQSRKENGFRLFGKYYQNLWD
jgi:hypothetical protein